jgi:FkbM family methyltransferase
MVNWSAIDPQSVPGRIVRLPSKLLPKSTIMRIRRGPAQGMKWITGSSLHGCWLGTFEVPKQRLLERLVRPGMIVYDIGAQAGFYTLILSRMIGESGHVFAFEPCAENLHYLLDHVHINRLTNVVVVQAAVGESQGLCGFSTDRGACENRLTEGPSAVMVPVLSLDSAGLPPPDLIKMDIEGGESHALRGAKRILSQYRPVVLVALHGPEHARCCPETLRAVGYKVFEITDHLVDGDAFEEDIYAIAAENEGLISSAQQCANLIVTKK